MKKILIAQVEIVFMIHQEVRYGMLAKERKIKRMINEDGVGICKGGSSIKPGDLVGRKTLITKILRHGQSKANRRNKHRGTVGARRLYQFLVPLQNRGRKRHIHDELRCLTSECLVEPVNLPQYITSTSK